MARKPNALTITKDVQNQIVRHFKEDTKDAKKIASWTLTPRQQVMLCLEQKGLRSYAVGSYC